LPSAGKRLVSDGKGGSELGPSPDAGLPTPSPTPIEVRIPDAFTPDAPTAKQLYFETIDKRTDSARIGRLRSKRLGENELEFRIWYGFGLTVLQGYVLHRAANGIWTGINLDSDFINQKFVDRSKHLYMPPEQWRTFWDSLKDHQVLTMPDGDAIHCSTIADDGFAYVVELKKGDSYRTYAYTNPQPCPEAKQLDEVWKLLNQVPIGPSPREAGTR